MALQKNILLVHGLKLSDFLFSCATAEVLCKDTKIITETQMGMFDFKRMTEKLTPHERRAAALARAAQLMKAFAALVRDPKGQQSFLKRCDAQRTLHRGNLACMFTETQRANEAGDAGLYFAAQAANDVQSVATIAFCVIAVGGPMAMAAGINSIGAGAGALATRWVSAKLSAAAYFAIPLAFRSIKAYATADANSTLAGFALPSIQGGLWSLGEVGSNLFNVLKDNSIANRTQLMNVAIGQWGRACLSMSYSVSALEKDANALVASMAQVKPGSSVYVRMAEELKAMGGKTGALATGGQSVAQSAVTGASQNQWLSAFGGRFVPIAFLASDVLSEYVRNEEMKSRLIEPGKRY